jgi:hypothetical protein
MSPTDLIIRVVIVTLALVGAILVTPSWFGLEWGPDQWADLVRRFL